LIIKLAYLKHQVSSGIYLSTLSILVHIFKFCKPDSLLLANFIAHIFKSFHKHARFLLFLKKVLLHIYNIFQFTGVKILITGKLNGFSRAQSKQLQIGQISLQTYDLPVYYGAADAFTRAGKIGIKV
jgi:ribosomal protein S3